MIRRYGRTCRSYADNVKTFTHDGIGFKCIKKQDRLRGEDYYVVLVSDVKYPHGGYIEVVDADSMDEAIEYFCSHFTPNPNRDGTVTLIRSRSAAMYAPRRRMYGRRQASGALRYRRAGKENWYMGIEGAWSVGGNEWSPSQITYYGCPVDADSVDNMVYEEFRYYCEDNGLEDEFDMDIDI